MKRTPLKELEPPPTAFQIRTMRHALGMSQHQLARRVGSCLVSPSWWEAGMSKPGPKFAAALRELCHQVGPEEMERVQRIVQEYDALKKEKRGY